MCSASAYADEPPATDTSFLPELFKHPLVLRVVIGLDVGNRVRDLLKHLRQRAPHGGSEGERDPGHGKLDGWVVEIVLMECLAAKKKGEMLDVHLHHFA